MADVKELTKLNRDQLNQLAEQNGIEDASDESKYNTKKDLAEALSPNVTPEALDEFLGKQTPSEETPTEETPATEPSESDQPEQTNDTPPIDSPEDVDDQSGVEPAPGTDDPSAAEEDEDEDDQADQPEEPAPSRSRRSKADADIEEGMGYPRDKQGKTLSIFSNKPHETVRNVGGVMVPLTFDEAIGNPRTEVAPKTDSEIQEKLRKLGRL